MTTLALSPRPVALAPLFGRFPSGLSEETGWVLWRYEPTARGRWTKIPYRADGQGKASVTDPATWAALPVARAAYERGGFDGVGIVLTNGIAGVDADKCVADDGEIEPWAADLLARFAGTYREHSPSGRGYRVFLRGTPQRCGKGGPDNRLEVYAKGSPRYLTVTGYALDDADVTDAQPALDWLHATHLTRSDRATGSTGDARASDDTEPSAGEQTAPAAHPGRPAGTLADDSLLDHARGARNGGKFADLWAGGHAGHASASEADAALVAILAFYTQDAAQIDRLFRRSGLYRPKWDERRGESTYGEQTVAAILAKPGERFGERVQRAGSARDAGVLSEPQDGQPAWPEALDPAAMHGIAGEFVRMVEPNTEADPAAILVQFLVCFGALVGRGPHYRVEGDSHFTNLYALLVGDTSKGRKGTSWGRVRQSFGEVADWKPHVSGLSSGEGLKYHVRDEHWETKPNKKGELVSDLVDAGVADKRLLVVETEFASALRAAQRQGNTLSATVREGWDTGNLRTLTKHDPITATGAHICAVGHITADELRAELTATDSANGFANRFLFVAVRRSKLLPFGGADDALALAGFAPRLQALAARGRTRARVTMTGDARAMWASVYPTLSEGRGGLHGAVTARAEAQVIRLSLVYALLDGAEEIDVPHLLAALAVWTYCDATARFVFGASLGDRIADEIVRRLRTAGDVGLTRTDIRDAFGRHQSEKIGAALDLLRRRGKATCESVSTGGRPTEVWRIA